MTLILLGSVLLVIPGLIAAVVYGLYGPVVIMEQRGVRGMLQRSRILSRRALGTVLVITLIQFTLPIIIGKAAVTTDLMLQLNNDWSPKQFGFNFSMSGRLYFRAVVECISHATDRDHGVAAVPQDSTGGRRVVERRQRSV
jgi:hypothetical protein